MFSGPVAVVSSRSRVPPQADERPKKISVPQGGVTCRSMSPARLHVMVKRRLPEPRHTPPSHARPAPQVRPQAPQLLALLERLTQVPPQLVVPAGHEQTPPAPHTPPGGDVQAPEVRGTALHTVPVPEHTIVPEFWHPPEPADVHPAPVTRQKPPQFDCPAGHASTHAPLMHDTEPPTGALHPRPQAPQLPASVERLRHVPPQFVCPAGHTQSPDALQTPPTIPVHDPEVRGAPLHVVPAPEHTMVPVL